MRVLAFALLALAAPATAAAGAPPRAACPHLGGAVRYAVNGTTHLISLTTCADRAIGPEKPATQALPGVTATGTTPGLQRLWVHGRLVYSQVETGPFVPLKLSGDGRWLFFFVDEYGAASAIADGVPLLVVSTGGGPIHDLGVTLRYPDYLTWCGGEVVYTPGFGRVAIDGKRLVAAAPPDWRPHSLWNDPSRTFSTPVCEPGRDAVAVLTQHTSSVANFFATRWRIWRVGLDGTRHALDVPPPGWADEEPAWSPDGNSLAFVRERNGYGRAMVLHARKVFGPLANLGYSIGYYGHHDWGIAWRR